MCAAQIGRIESRGRLRTHSRIPHEPGFRGDGAFPAGAANRAAASERRRGRGRQRFQAGATQRCQAGVAQRLQAGVAQRLQAGAAQRRPRHRCVARPPSPERRHAPALVAPRSRSVATRRHLGRARPILECAMDVRRHAHDRRRSGAGCTPGRHRSPLSGQRLGRSAVARRAEAALSRQRARLHRAAGPGCGSRRVLPEPARVRRKAGGGRPRSDELLPDQPRRGTDRLRVGRRERGQRGEALSA